MSFVAVLAVAAASSTLVRDHLIHSAQARFDTRAAHVTADLRRDLAAYSQAVYAANGFLAAAMAGGAKPEPDAWRRYVSRLDLEEMLPAMRALGYADAPGIEQTTTPASASDAAPLPPGTASTPPTAPFAPVVLAWPDTADAGQGTRDLGSDAVRRAALLRAADGARIVLDIHPAPLESSGANPASAGLYLPAYREAANGAPASRRAALAGFVFAQVDLTYLIASVAAQEPHIDMRITAGSSGVTLYPANGAPAEQADEPPVFRHTDTLRIGGESLTLDYATSTPSLVAGANDTANAILGAGALAALMAAIAVFALLRKQNAKTADAGFAHSQSTLNEARMMAIIRSSMEAIITVDEAQRIVIFNPMAERVFGCSAMDAIGAPLERFIPDRFRAAHKKHVEQFGVTGVSERQMGRQRVLFGLRANGEEFPIEASISQIRDATGKLYTVMLRDVTERVRAENELKTSREELRELSANLQNVREEEKTRIARELHDDLGQQLTALKMDLSAVEQTLGKAPPAPPAVTTRLASMRRLIDATVASARRIAADLRPVMLDDLGLVPAIEWLANDFANRYGIEVERRIEPGDTVFTRNSATTIFRIVQEALTNVARHAEATRVSIALAIEGDQCMLRIVDNGLGAAESHARTGNKSFGLLGIRERAHMLGGTVAVETSERHGFAITVLLPLAAVQPEETQP
ncbi:PAS domain S-box protein [Trinickia violacea]|nr:PAS domain S-box protein [Trinickia violacea]